MSEDRPVTDLVTRARNGDKRAWDDFVRAQPDGTFFHLSGWRRVIERAFNHRTYYLVAERGRTLTGVLPLTHVKSLLFGSSLVSNAFAVPTRNRTLRSIRFSEGSERTCANISG